MNHFLNHRVSAETQTSSRWDGADIVPLKMAPGGAWFSSAASSVLSAPASKKVFSLWHQVFTLLAVAVLSILAYFSISRFVVTPVIIQGRSMMPTLNDGECYVLNRWIYQVQSPERGDVVVLVDPGHSDLAVKRIIAKPGDWLNLKENGVYLNGHRLQEAYLSKDTHTRTPDAQEKWVQLGAGEYFVMGDNRDNSEDSRFYGRITRTAILGQIRR